MSGLPTITPYPMPTPDTLPTQVPPWSIDPERAVLLLHDMQSYFLEPFPLELREELVGNAAALRDRCAHLGMPVAYTAQPGGMTREQRGLLKDFWGPGMRVDPAERGVVTPVAPGPEDWVFTKWRYSAFFNTDLLERMRAHRRDQLLICGVYAHVGVLMSAVESFSHDIETFLAADAIADFTEADHRLALDYAARRCAVVATTKEFFG